MKRCIICNKPIRCGEDYFVVGEDYVVHTSCHVELMAERLECWRSWIKWLRKRSREQETTQTEVKGDDEGRS